MLLPSSTSHTLCSCLIQSDYDDNSDDLTLLHYKHQPEHNDSSQSALSSVDRIRSPFNQLPEKCQSPPTFTFSSLTMLLTPVSYFRSKSTNLNIIIPKLLPLLFHLLLLSLSLVNCAPSSGVRRYPPFSSSFSHLRHHQLQQQQLQLQSAATTVPAHWTAPPSSRRQLGPSIRSQPISTLSYNFHSFTNLDQHIVNKCQQNCPLQLNLEDDLDIACNSTCKIEQCENGCKFWNNRPLSCYDVCQNSTNNWIIKYCAIGCNHAHLVYVEYVKSLIGLPEAPKLVLGSLSNDSLTIEWGTVDRSRVQNVTYRVQWRYANLASVWTYATDMVGNQNEQDGRLRLSSLYAYTGYHFRVEWIIVPWLRISLYSKVSEAIVTLPYGVPTTPCLITSCMSISPTQITVSWQPPEFSNGPIIAYTLYLTENATGHRLVKDLQMHSEHYQLFATTSSTTTTKNHSSSMNYVFNGLSPGTEYQLSIVTFNNFGEGPVCKQTISTMMLAQQQHNNQDVDSDQDRTQPMSEYRHQFSSGGNSDNPYKLFIASTKEVGRRNPDLLLDEEIIYHLTDYSENSEITGMAIHVQRKYLFVSDSSGTVRRVLLQEDQSINQVLRIIDGSNNPSHLSIDWLNDKLYFLEDNRISRCNLDGDSIESVVTGFRKRPLEMKVDPYNGYLYWLVADQYNQTGLYRVDLAEIVSGTDVLPRTGAAIGATPGSNSNNNNGSAATTTTVNNIQLIYQSGQHFSTFAVSYFDYRILFPISEHSSEKGGVASVQTSSAPARSSVYSITIDGKDSVNIRDNSASADVFVGVENMIIYNQKLYFTKDTNISWEEFHQGESQYYHNIYNTEQRLISLLVMDYQSQPYPIPLNPVRSVQAVFLDTQAKISWQSPERFGGSGIGAWQQWNYEVSIVESEGGVDGNDDDSSGNGYLAKVNNSTNCVAMELQPDTEYLIKVRAWSIAGKGRWSDRFRGRTLPTIGSEEQRFAVVSTDEGLLKTDLVGNIVDRLVSRSKLNGFLINDIAWYRDLILINTESALMAYNHTSQQYNLTKIGNVTNAASIAIDWLAPKLYWSNPNERMICRSNLDGSQPEILPILTSANQIVVDSENGFLYWSTVYSVEYQRLNGGFGGDNNGGDNSNLKRSTERILFRGNDIRSLSINHHRKLLYFIAQSNGISQLYRMKLVDLHYHQPNNYRLDSTNVNEEEHHIKLPEIEPIATLSNPSLRGPIAWLSERMFWLETEQNQILISDPQAQTFATINDLKQIYSFAIVSSRSGSDSDDNDNRFQTIKRNVVPLAVDPESIHIVGTWNNFTLQWSPITNVNYGQVFYDLVLEVVENQGPGKKLNLVQNHTKFRYCFGDRECPTTSREHQEEVAENSQLLKLSTFNFSLKPYSKLIVAIRSFTYWASSRQVVRTLHTPSSIPSKPRQVRVFTYPESDHSLSLTSNGSDDLNIEHHRLGFDTTYSTNLVVAETRWEEPENPNGIILSYTVSLWSTVLGDGVGSGSQVGNSKESSSIINKVIPNQLSYRFRDLQPNSTYYFEVRATTDSGEGPASDVLQLKTFNNRPPSRLLLVEPDSLRLADIDLGQSRLIARSLSPLMVDYLYRDNVLYWIEEGNFLKRITLSNRKFNETSDEGGHSNFTLIAHLHERATGLTIDWIGLRVYVSTVDRYRNRSSIWYYDHSGLINLEHNHDHHESDPEKIHLVASFDGCEIVSLRINPFTSELVWTETELRNSNQHTTDSAILRVCQLENYGTRCGSVRNLFSNNRTELRERSCNCSYSTTVAPSFVLDFSSSRQHMSSEMLSSSSSSSSGTSKSPGRIIYYDLQSKYFAVSDMGGCSCRRFSRPILPISTTSIVSMSYDASMLYWKNDTTGIIYRTPVYEDNFVDSNTRPIMSNNDVDDKERTFVDYRHDGGTIRSFISYNVHHQPYPELSCLIPHNLRTSVRMVHNTAYSLTLDIDTNQTSSNEVERTSTLSLEDHSSNNNVMSSKWTSANPVDCGRLSLASLHYHIRYRKHYSNIQIDCRRNEAKQCASIDSFNRTVTVGDLDPFTNYTFLIELDNFYLRQSRYRAQVRANEAAAASSAMDHPGEHNSIRYYPTTTNTDITSFAIEDDFRMFLLEDRLVFATAESRPGPPQNVRAVVENPEKILILWDRPEKLNSMEISYEVRWYSVESNRKSMIRHSETNQTRQGSYYMYLENVRPGKEYNVSVRAYSVDNHQFMDSPPLLVRSFDEPNPLKILKIAPRLVLLRWISPSLSSQSTIETHQLNLQQDMVLPSTAATTSGAHHSLTTSTVAPVNWTTFVREKTRAHSSYEFIVKNLKPNTRYRFQMSLVYSGLSKSLFLWPHKFLTLTTKSDVPDIPQFNPPTPIKYMATTAANSAISTMIPSAATTTTSATTNSRNSGNSEKDLVSASTATTTTTTTTTTITTANIFKINWDPVGSNSPDTLVYYLLYQKVIEEEDDESESDNDGQNDLYDSTTEEDDVDRSYDTIQSEHSVSLAYSDNRERIVDVNDDLKRKSLKSSNNNVPNQWNLVYNGTETYWIISGLESGRRHTFRLAALNSVGSSRFSAITKPFLLPFQSDVPDSSESMLLLVIVFCSTGVLFLLVVALFSLHRHQIKEKSLDNGSLNYPMELVPWQELPSHPHHSNALYINSNVESTDLGDIEIIDHSNISLNKFLGSGAFGKVYEGLLHKTETRVAVKVLGKGATEDEQLNFLKEAKFMAKFKHPHILQLLGVCLNSDQHIIVMELMEGGDLLKYLRANRPMGLAPSPLTMDDLLTIIIDIAKGSHYLEQIHFVHRDLAARNCLVSSIDRQQRVVKIADFGLTRGLYKQNYYRKEGGLLPVRWMAPESLVDGVFTTQSDVWSFAIIMYEVMTLGQQPYQALSNSQVLEFVKSGGILSQPNGCPYELYSLMKLCWNYDKEARPSFGEILKDLEDIHNRYREQIMSQPLPTDYVNGLAVMAQQQQQQTGTLAGMLGPSTSTSAPSGAGDLRGLSQLDSSLFSGLVNPGPIQSTSSHGMQSLGPCCSDSVPNHHTQLTVHNQNYQLARNSIGSSSIASAAAAAAAGYLNGGTRPTPIYEGSSATIATTIFNGIGESAATSATTTTISSGSPSSFSSTSTSVSSPDNNLSFVDFEGYQIPIRSKHPNKFHHHHHQMAAQSAIPLAVDNGQ